MYRIYFLADFVGTIGGCEIKKGEPFGLPLKIPV
jgi:hypothetical protein